VQRSQACERLALAEAREAERREARRRAELGALRGARGAGAVERELRRERRREGEPQPGRYCRKRPLSAAQWLLR
jgi:hypothetical protein